MKNIEKILSFCLVTLLTLCLTSNISAIGDKSNINDYPISPMMLPDDYLDFNPLNEFSQNWVCSHESEVKNSKYIFVGFVGNIVDKVNFNYVVFADSYQIVGEKVNFNGTKISRYDNEITTGSQSITNYPGVRFIKGDAYDRSSLILNACRPLVPKFSVSGSSSPVGSGSINGLGSFEQGSNVNLTAVPNSGWLFDKWDDGSTNSNRVINNLQSDLSVVAYFKEDSNKPQYISSNGQLELLSYQCVTEIRHEYLKPENLETWYQTIYTYRYNYHVFAPKGYLLQIGNKFYKEYVTSSQVYKYQSDFTRAGCSEPKFNNGSKNFLIVKDSSDGQIEVNDSIGNELIENGNQHSQDASNNLDQNNNDLNNKIDEFDNFGNQFQDDLNNSLNGIDLNTDLVTDSSFLKSVNFVKSCFDGLTNNNPIGLTITFTCIVGLALLIIGKRLKV